MAAVHYFHTFSRWRFLHMVTLHSNIVTRGTGYETLQVSKAITEVLQFMLKVLRQCTIFCFTLAQQGRLLSAQARKSFQIFFVLGIFDEHAVFGEVEFDNLNFKRKSFINTLSTCQVEHFAIKRNSIWRQLSLFDIACGNFAADEDLFM